VLKKTYSNKELKNHILIIKTRGIDSPGSLSILTNFIINAYGNMSSKEYVQATYNNHVFFHNINKYIICLTGISTENTKIITAMLHKEDSIKKFVSGVKHIGYESYLQMGAQYNNLILVAKGGN